MMSSDGVADRTAKETAGGVGANRQVPPGTSATPSTRADALAALERDGDGWAIPKTGTRIPTRAELGALIGRIVEDVTRSAGLQPLTVSQPLAELLAQYLDAIYAHLSGPPHLPASAVHEDSRRLDKLFRLLPFDVRHRFGGDEKEFREGIDAAKPLER